MVVEKQYWAIIKHSVKESTGKLDHCVNKDAVDRQCIYSSLDKPVAFYKRSEASVSLWDCDGQRVCAEIECAVNGWLSNLPSVIQRC